MENDVTLQEILKDIERELTDPSIIIDNKLPFQYNNEWYRVRMPNQREEAEAQNEKNALFGKLIQTEGYYMRKRLMQILKEKQGIDLASLEEEKYRINLKIQDYQLILAKKCDDDIKAIEELKLRITDLISKRIEITMEINQYLSASIEEQLEKIYIQSLCSSCTEKMEMIDGKENWKRFWPNLKTFQDESSPLINKALSFMTYILLNVRS